MASYRPDELQATQKQEAEHGVTNHRHYEISSEISDTTKVTKTQQNASSSSAAATVQHCYGASYQGHYKWSVSELDTWEKKTRRIKEQTKTILRCT